MKRIIVIILVLLMLTGYGGKDTIIGRWETESNADMLGLSMNDNFISTVTKISFLEEGIGTWEIELVQTREILRREFSYTLEGDQLSISYPDGTAQKFTVNFEKGILNLTGMENLSLKRVS